MTASDRKLLDEVKTNLENRFKEAKFEIRETKSSQFRLFVDTDSRNDSDVEYIRGFAHGIAYILDQD